MENTLTRVTYNNENMTIAFKYDLRNTKKMMESIQEQSELLRLRLEQQELISDISKGFVSSGDTQIYVKDAITKLGSYHKASSVLIYSIDYEHSKTHLEYHWLAKDEQIQLINFDLFNMVKSSFPERLAQSGTLPIIACADTHGNEAYLKLLDANINAFIGAPLYTEGRLWGIITVIQNYKPRQWTDNEKKFVAIIAGTIAGGIMRDIYNKMLKDALDKATTASKAKGEFLSNMSHEMRTPLNAIIGMTKIGKNAAELDRKDYSLGKIEDASTHLLGVINDVLDISKIEANKFELSPVEFNFEKMLQKVVNVIHFRIEEKRQKLTVHIDKKIPEYLIGDDQRLNQVVTNLLGNAVKFTPEEGTIDLNALLLKEEKGTCTLKISVADSGIGISDDQKEHLFQSFRQAEASTVRKFGGTGLGLAISKSIVEMMDGKIWVESEFGKGSNFSFTIQAKRGEGKIKNLHDRAANWDDIRILAVDDDPDILEIFKEISNRYNLHCDTALKGETALRLIERNGDYNVYFIDWKMPGIDGIALSGAIKSMEKKQGYSVVIMISAVEWTEIEKKAKAAGVDRFLSKPLFPSTIVDTICECLGIDWHTKAKEKNLDADVFKGHRVLLAEDVEINREIVLTILEPMGLEIDCAENGVQAVEMYRANPDRYELIFMDVQMPEMDGYDATRHIRALEDEKTGANKDKKRIPIVAMTANVFKEDIQKCIEAGMDDHLGKPLDFNDVIEKIKTYLS